MVGELERHWAGRRDCQLFSAQILWHGRREEDIDPKKGLASVLHCFSNGNSGCARSALRKDDNSVKGDFFVYDIHD